MRRRTFKLSLVLCLIAGIVEVTAPVANAQPQPPAGVEQLVPNDTQFASGGNCVGPVTGTPQGCIGDYLSDKHDGVHALAHLTAVATPETTEVTWYVCPLGSTVNTQAALSGCNRIGSENDQMQRVGQLGPPVDESFHIYWDIPNSLDHMRRDIVALACSGFGQTQIEGTNANCRVDEEDSIFLEDAQTGPTQNQSSAGEFGQYRTLQSCFNIASGDTACDAAFEPFHHGILVPNDGFDFLAFTSKDVDNLQTAVNEPADAQNEPNNATYDGVVTCTLEQTFTDYKRWLCAIGAALVANDAELSISLIDANGGGSLPEGTAGYCNANNNPNADTDSAASGTQPPSASNQVMGAHDTCMLDAQYVVSAPRTATRFVQTLYSDSVSSSCSNRNTDETVDASTTIDVALCIYDQFEDPIQARWTEETSGEGLLADCGPEGSPHDHNNDGRYEDCVGDTGPDGVSDGITVQNPGGASRDQTLIGCYDPQNQLTVPTVANHGCADASASLRASLKVFWIGSGGSSGSISGRVTDPDGQPVHDAGVQICRVEDAVGNPSSGPCVLVSSATDGVFSAGSLPDGKYVVTVNPPESKPFLVQGGSGKEVVTQTQVTHIDVSLSRRAPPPPATTIAGSTVGDDGLPVITRGDATVHGRTCPFEVGTATVTVRPNPPLTVSLMPDPDGPPGSYIVTLPTPNSTGLGEVVVTADCLDGSHATVRFHMVYIDPSGVVVDTNGALLEQATVILFRSDDATGPFVQVPDQDVIMSPSNRTNPDLTDAVGHFGWDVLAGFYRVRAEKAGCVSPDDPSKSFIETEALEIPPPVTDLVLVLKCLKSVFASKVRLRKSPGRFKGRVKSPSNHCVEHRRVVLMRKRPGADKAIKRAMARSNGRFRFRRQDLPNGRYYAKVRGRRAPGVDGTQVVCKRAISRRLRP